MIVQVMYIPGTFRNVQNDDVQLTVHEGSHKTMRATAMLRWYTNMFHSKINLQVHVQSFTVSSTNISSSDARYTGAMVRLILLD